MRAVSSRDTVYTHPMHFHINQPTKRCGRGNSPHCNMAVSMRDTMTEAAIFTKHFWKLGTTNAVQGCDNT